MKFIFLYLLILAGCNTSDPGFSPILGIERSSSELTKIDVEITGLGNSPLSLTLNDETSFFVQSNGIYQFKKRVTKNSEFKVSIAVSPSDRNCTVFHPTNKALRTKETVNIFCTESANHYFSGFVQGHNGTLQLQKGVETILVTTEMNQYLFETPGSGSEPITITSPPGQDCYFSKNNLASLSTTGASDLNIYCAAEMIAGYSIILNVTGLTGTLKVTHANSTKVPTEDSFTGSGGYIAISQPLSNQRQIFEITDAPDDQRCYFNASGNHLHSMNLPVPQDQTVNVTCVPRATCEYGGLEFFSTNGLIKDITCLNDRLYLGGTFTLVGRQLGLQSLRFYPGGIGLNTNEISFFDRIHGSVRSIISDGRGGYFVGGNFRQVGDKRIKSLVRLDKNFIIDESFNWQTDGGVTKIILESNELFIFGNFSNLLSGTKSYSRKGFAKLILGSGSPKLSSLQLPPGLESKVASADVIDSKIYMYGRFIQNSVAKNISFQMNRYSGSFKLKESAFNDNANTLFWKEPLTGKVWMINFDYGLSDPLTLAPHPQDVAYSSVLKNHYYTLDSSSRLHMSDGTSLKYVNLSDLYSAAQGPSASAYPVTVNNAGPGKAVGDNICFRTLNELQVITINPGLFTHSGLACFDSGLNLLNANPGFRLKLHDFIAVPDGSDFKVITGSPFFSSSLYRGIVSMRMNDPYNIINHADITSGKVESLAHDGTYIYYGGDFTTANGNSNLQRSGAFAPDSGWSFSPSLEAVKKIAISSNHLFVSSNTTGMNFFGLNLTPNDTSLIQVSPTITTPPENILSVSGTVATLESGVLNFRELGTLASGADPLTSLSSQVNIASDESRYLTLASPDRIEYRDTDGGIDYDLPVSSFDPTSTEILVNSNSNSTCLFTRSGKLQCYDSGSGFSILSKDYADRNFIFKKSVGNFYFFTDFQAAPEILVP